MHLPSSPPGAVLLLPLARPSQLRPAPPSRSPSNPSSLPSKPSPKLPNKHHSHSCPHHHHLRAAVECQKTLAPRPETPPEGGEGQEGADLKAQAGRQAGLLRSRRAGLLHSSRPGLPGQRLQLADLHHPAAVASPIFLPGMEGDRGKQLRQDRLLLSAKQLLRGRTLHGYSSGQLLLSLPPPSKTSSNPAHHPSSLLPLSALP